MGVLGTILHFVKGRGLLQLLCLVMMCAITFALAAISVGGASHHPNMNPGVQDKPILSYDNDKKLWNVSAMGDASYTVSIVKFAENSTGDLNPTNIFDSQDTTKAKLPLGKYLPDQFPHGITSSWHIDKGRSKHPAMNWLRNVVILQMYDINVYNRRHPIHGFSSVDAPAVQNLLHQVERDGNATIERIEHAIFFHQQSEHNIQHFFFDAIPRLWIYKDLQAAGVNPIILISPTAYSFVPQTLEMMGFPYRVLGKDPVIVDNLFKSLNYNLNFVHKDIKSQHLWRMITQTREAALAHVGLATAGGNPLAASHRRIYLSRMRDAFAGVGRKLENEVDLARRLESRGFVVVDAAEYSIQQRAELFRDTKVVCSLMGAGLTNIIFMVPKANVIIIDHPHFTGDWFNDTIGPMFNLNVSTINGLGVVTAPSTNWHANEMWKLDIDKAIQRVDTILSSDTAKV